uniref:hypothetical protein n=1 Tax=Pseudomonas aeruginosa TaxID=287 RepID=UPI0029C85D0C|nr:hypothetical protein [Pseudomonas aeruginosa]
MYSWEFFITRWPATCHLDDGPLVRVVHHAAAVFQHYGSQVDGSSSSHAAPGQRNLTHSSESSSSRPTGQGQQYQSLDMAMPSWSFVGAVHHAPSRHRRLIAWEFFITLAEAAGAAGVAENSASPERA